MIEFPHIPTVYKRDPDTQFKTLIEGSFATPELALLVELPWVWTEMVDGMNIRVLWEDGVVTFHGRTDKSELPTAIRRSLGQLLRAGKFVKAEIECPLTLYGEAYGVGIQKAGRLYKAGGQSFVLFDVLYLGRWLERTAVLDIALRLNIEAVPHRGTGTLSDMVSKVRAPLKSRWGDFQAEGLVGRPIYELQDGRGNRIITKVKCHDFIR